MLKFNMSLEDWYIYTKKKRNIINPNIGFLKQLKNLEIINFSKLHNVNKNNKLIIKPYLNTWWTISHLLLLWTIIYVILRQFK